MNFLNNDIVPIELQEISMFLLMYADDMVIFSETAAGLQEMLSSLENYTERWSLTVNVEKSKILIFRNCRKLSADLEWFIRGEKIEIVDTFCYLGILLNFNGKFHVAQNQLALQCKKALFALKRKCCNMSLNYITLLSLFDTYIGSIAHYGCEVWGFHRAPEIEKVHIDFCKNILGVKRSTPNAAIYCELGRFPLQCVRKLRILKYWLKLLSSQNCILKSCYEFMLRETLYTNNCKNWASEVKNLLSHIGLMNFWINQDSENPKYIMEIAKQRLFDNYRQCIIADMNSSSKCLIYKNIIDHFTLQSYLTKRIPLQYKKLISKLRLSSHCLAVETGRYKNIPLERRLCPLCSVEIEDEFHFILVCFHYQNLRVKFLKKYYYVRPSVYKLIQLFSTQNVKELCNLGKFIKNALAIRKSLL